ncbi:MAG: hypothetical protein ACK4OP_12745, partial [Gemmobacter sp.]
MPLRLAVANHSQESPLQPVAFGPPYLVRDKAKNAAPWPPPTIWEGQRNTNPKRPGMSLSEEFLTADDLHPIDIVETLAEHRDWE